ncbi:MAG: ABC transporter substrate-binding protein [Planctomycetes bacterium]|nr:ABC transporter substrate-binding protein [Planctomycetota bacterium]
MLRILPALCLLSALTAADGVTPSAILVGQACPLDGPAKGLGLGMSLGLKAAFAEANAGGGVGGRQVELRSVDDGYDPDKCADATAGLIEEAKVFCLAGLVGTPTSKAAVPLAVEAGVPVVGLFTGAMAFREPAQRLVFNVRASYDDETEMLVERLTADLGAKRIAIFRQNDSFGAAGLSGTEKALKKRSLELAGAGTFERNTVAVKTGLAAVLAAKPDAVVMVGPYKPIAAFVREARAAGLACPLATISFVGTESLIAELGAEADGLIISQVVPSPADESLAVVRAYRAALTKADAAATPSYVSLEGYISGRILLLGLAAAGAEPTRDSLVAGLESLTAADLGGLTAAFGPQRRQALGQVWLTKVAGGAARPAASLK